MIPTIEDLQDADRHFELVSKLHRRHERTDRLLLLSSLITFALALWLNQMWGGWWAPMLAGISGLSAGVTVTGRRIRREAYERLAESYDALQRYRNAPLN